MDLYLFRHEEQTGPYTEADARALVATRGIERTCLAWQEGMTDWMPLEEVIALPELERLVTPGPAQTPGLSDRSYLQYVRRVPRNAIYAVVAFLTVGLILIYFLRRPDAPLPNRDNFKRALATVHFVAAPPGKIIVADQWNQTLVLEFRPKELEFPALYQIVVPADQLPIDYENFTNVPSGNDSETDLPGILDRNKLITLDSPVSLI